MLSLDKHSQEKHFKESIDNDKQRDCVLRNSRLMLRGIITKIISRLIVRKEHKAF